MRYPSKINRYASFCMFLTLISCQRQTLDTFNMHFPTSNDPGTTAFYHQIRTSLKIPDGLDVTFHPFHYGHDEPISSISRTNYSFYHDYQSLSLSCCKNEQCIDKTFHLYALKLTFPDAILRTPTVHDMTHTTENIQQWLNNDCQ